MSTVCCTIAGTSPTNGVSASGRISILRPLGRVNAALAAEAVRYAHSRSLYHRALAARSVYVSAKADGSNPTARIIDWQSAARDPETTGISPVRATMRCL